MTVRENEALIELLEQVHVIALVGASDKAERDSYRVMAYLQQHGYRVIPVNPRLAGSEVLGEKVYGSVSAIPEAIDMVDVFLNPERVLPITEETINRNVKVLWLQLGVINQQAAELAENAGLTVVMDRCPKQILEQQEYTGS